MEKERIKMSEITKQLDQIAATRHRLMVTSDACSLLGHDILSKAIKRDVVALCRIEVELGAEYGLDREVPY